MLAAPVPAAALPDAVMSPNVEYLGSIQQDVGLTTGAKVVGNRMFVTSGKNISIYDMSDPGAPRPLGAMKANVGGVDFVRGPGRAVPQAGNGVCVDGEPVAGALGCSVHWFHEHPSFADGGLVAIGADGSITEQGYLLSLGVIVVVAQVRGQGRRPLRDRLRHPALGALALRAGIG